MESNKDPKSQHADGVQEVPPTTPAKEELAPPVGDGWGKGHRDWPIDAC